MTLQDCSALAGSLAAATPVETLDFESVYAQHFAFVWRNLRRLGVPEAGLRDAAQDVFIVVHRRLGEFEGRSSVSSWLYSIARRVAATHRRHRERKEPANGEDAELVADPHGVDPESHTVQSESLRLLLELLGRLDPERRDVLVLVDLEGMSVPEVSVALGCNLNTTYSRLRSAREFMRSGVARSYLARGGRDV